MYSLNLTYRMSPYSLTLNFKTFKDFDELRKKAIAMLAPLTEQEVSLSMEKSDLLSCEDHYGTGAMIHMSDVASVVWVERDKDWALGAEIQVGQQKELMKAANALGNDPMARILKPANAPLVTN